MTNPTGLTIISGGQTGVDRAALDAAIALCIPHGGFCTRDRRAEDGTIPPHYRLTPLPASQYLARTRRNVMHADATVIVYLQRLTGGTARTAGFCEQLDKPLLLIDARRQTSRHAAAQLDDFIRAQQLQVLNVAGPRASQWQHGYQYTHELLLACFSPTGERS